MELQSGTLFNQCVGAQVARAGRTANQGQLFQIGLYIVTQCL